MVSQLGRAAGFERSDDVAARQAKLDNLLGQTSTKPEDATLIADLLSLNAVGRYPQPKLSPQQRKDRTLAALVGQVQSLARRRPVLMVFEDVHWSDPSSGELLDLTIESTRNLPVLILVTYRPEFVPPWIGQSRVTVITLNRLDERDGAVLARSMAGDQGLTDDVINDIVARADGVPLFVEELTKSILETGGASRTPRTKAVATSVPDRLHGPLMARLDAVGAAKEVAQAGSAIGREFTYELLTAVSQLKPAQLRGNLAALTDAGLIIQRGTPPHATYQFKHALIQDAAYGTLLREPRQRLHARIAEVLTKQFPEMALPEVLAQHYSRAGLSEQSIEAWQLAGERAAARSGFEEATAHFNSGLMEIALLPEGRKRQKLELDLRLSLMGTLASPKGWVSPEIREHHLRARALAEALDDREKLAHVIFGEFARLHTIARYDMALQVARELIDLAEKQKNPTLKAVAYTGMGMNSGIRGEFVSSLDYLQRGYTLFGNCDANYAIAFTGYDVPIYALSWLSCVLAIQGCMKQSEVRVNEMMARAQLYDHAPSVAHALFQQVVLRWIARDFQGMKLATNRIIALTATKDLRMYRALGNLSAAVLDAEIENSSDGIERIRDGLSSYRKMGYGLHVSFYLLCLSRAHLRAQDIKGGLDVVDEALSFNKSASEHWNDAELLRVKGELLLVASPPRRDEAESTFKQSIAFAQSQVAKTWELRAATSLARLYRSQGRASEARDILAPIYAWFTDGFEWPDLTDARALLVELD